MSVFNSSRLAGKTVFISESSYLLCKASAAADGAICRNRARILLPTRRSSRFQDTDASSTAGGSSGIGAATAVLFARAGANIIITARRQAQLDATAAEAKKANQEGGTGKGGQVVTLVLDMQDSAAVKSVLTKLPKELAKVDILVNNAGLVYGKDQVGEIDEEEIVKMFSASRALSGTRRDELTDPALPDTNVIGLISLTQIFVRGVSYMLTSCSAITDPRATTEFKKQHSGQSVLPERSAGRELTAFTVSSCSDRLLARSLTQVEQFTRPLVGPSRFSRRRELTLPRHTQSTPCRPSRAPWLASLSTPPFGSLRSALVCTL